MNQEWILQTKETRRKFSNSTWVPLRATQTDENGDVKNIGYVSEFFGCGSAAFPPDYKEIAGKLSWSDLGISRNIQPYAYKDGYYSSIEQFQYNDKESIGVNLIFEHYLHVVGVRKWILNPDLIVALHLIKEGDNWVRPEEDFAVVAREIFDKDGNHTLIEIKREYLIDYLAARNLALRMTYYRQRVENVQTHSGSVYATLTDRNEQRDEGRFEFRIRNLNDIFGGSWALFRTWRTDVDEDDDAPVMGPENNENTGYESEQGHQGGFAGVRIEGEFWRDEWIDHQGTSIRVRGDADTNLPQFIVETDGSRMSSHDLDDEDIGRWLWFRSGIVSELLNHRGFSLGWYTEETGCINSTSGRSTHFGINSSELITVYAYDIARLEPWEQHVWAAFNVVPEGKVSNELLSAQVKTQVASTNAAESLLFKSMRTLERCFHKKFNLSLYSHEIEDTEVMQHISRFASKDQASLLKLAKELVRVFTDRLDVSMLRKLSTHADKDKLGSNRLLQDILAQSVGPENAREIFGPIVGAYDMRVGDAHPTSSKIIDAIKLAGIDERSSFLKQGEQLISNFGKSIFEIYASLCKIKN